MKVYCVIGLRNEEEDFGGFQTHHDFITVCSTKTIALEYIDSRKDNTYESYYIEEEDVRDSI